jgi:hypothetical protein
MTAASAGRAIPGTTLPRPQTGLTSTTFLGRQQNLINAQGFAPPSALTRRLALLAGAMRQLSRLGELAVSEGTV